MSGSRLARGHHQCIDDALQRRRHHTREGASEGNHRHKLGQHGAGQRIVRYIKCRLSRTRLRSQQHEHTTTAAACDSAALRQRNDDHELHHHWNMCHKQGEPAVRITAPTVSARVHPP
ncbi:hypothetical protein DQ04_20601010 [Trypanosoma grayi]|uniref:hypothetical protein n=1 Tax=Trypanosoma grayi TaxID=71804 RepID=UPI0004F46A60|nr:hypothetical protein DQ04_20601010 [Trypanosoma grayi]KEG05549.1 hypothetical protein DQ04_20601010 [Trypanosoma grayi]